MRPDKAIAILRAFTYKPGVAIELGRSMECDGIDIRLSCEVPDVRQSDERITVVFRDTIAPPYTTSNLVARFRLAVLAFEEHEMDEWLKFDGKNVTNPHRG